jgi:hypothetical protein
VQGAYYSSARQGPGQLLGTAVKSKNLGGWGRLRAGSTLRWLGVIAER